MTLMRQEISEIPEAVDRLLLHGVDDLRRAADAVRARDPRVLVSIARGSSDHVCTFLKYAAELLTGVPMASVGPSVASVYGARMRLDGAVALAVSQSGQSPDIVEMAQMAGRDGALTLALTNAPASPLARGVQHPLNIHAGPERSVAATKTFVTSAVAGLLLLAHWRGDSGLKDALHRLPGHLDQAAHGIWSPVQEAMTQETTLYTLGRDPALAMSAEAALKFKETCQIHAESYSSAEVLHGPVSIVSEGFPVLCFAVGDAAETSVVQAAEQMSAKGARVFVTSALPSSGTALPHTRTGHPLTDPISLITTFYATVEAVAVARGIDPDAPRHLQKVTETV